MMQIEGDQKTTLLTILAQNIGIRGSALPLPARVHTAWAKGLGLKRGGETILFTGHMYQMMPYLMALQRQRSAISPRMQLVAMRLARVMNPILNLSYLSTLGQVRPNWRHQYEKTLKNILILLKKNGIDPGYLYEREPYAGTLAYDLGLDSVFERHACRVARVFREAGVKTVITVDPHSTEILKNIFPQVVPGFEIEVMPYFQILMKKDIKGLATMDGACVTIHDSCIYARYLGLVEEARGLIKKTGATIDEVRFSKEITHCCGGPIETIFPERARDIAKNRMDELGERDGDTIITMCPICHLNLSGQNGPKKRVVDLASFLCGK